MEQIRRAKAHVARPGFKEKLDRICNASAEKIEAAMQGLTNPSVKDVLLSTHADEDVKVALTELMVFTSEVIGSDGARARLRHEQNGYALMFGPAGGFLTPNMADVRSPLVLVLHGAGGEEKHVVDLFAEEPEMPNAREMLNIIAADPVAQARFFILSMRLFCEHVLGTGPFDASLRHHGKAGINAENPIFPDGFAASGLGGAFGFLAALHGPIEEQARLSIHPHILLWFVHTQSEYWLRTILKRETAEAREALRVWQEKVLEAVQSMQLDSAAVLPLLLRENPAEGEPPRNTPFSAQHQADCRMDGKLEGDVCDPDRRRPLLATEPLFKDHHIAKHHAEVEPGQTPKPDYLVPLTGAQLSKLPHYRLFSPCYPFTTADLESEDGRLREAEEWAKAYAEDYRLNISVGQMHEHKDTCFKYIIDKAVRFAKHCRFHFCHFVKLFLHAEEAHASSTQASSPQKHVREVTLARTGKALVLPRLPGQPTTDLVGVTSDGEPQELKPTCGLGPTVVVDPDHGRDGKIQPIRWNPLEGSSNGPAQVATRGNCDYQNMARVMPDGFDLDAHDRLRDFPETEAELERREEELRERFEESLPDRVKRLQKEKRRKGHDEVDDDELAQELRNLWQKRHGRSTGGGLMATTKR